MGGKGLLSVNPTSGCLDLGTQVDSGSLLSWAQDSTSPPPLLQWERAAGEGLMCFPLTAQTLQTQTRRFTKPLSDHRKEPLFCSFWHIVKWSHGLEKLPAGQESSAFYSSTAAHGFPLNLCVGPRSIVEMPYASMQSLSRQNRDT